MTHKITRRNFLQTAGTSTAAFGAAAAGVSALGGCSLSGDSGGSALRDAAAPRRKRVLRIAHLTDTHVTPGKGAPEGMAACLDHVHALPDRPDVIFTGGDCIMDSLNADEESVRAQWAVWTTAFKEHCSLPVYSCLGNHDIWGWNKGASRTTGSEPLYGKKWARQVFGVKSHYRSFDLSGWHFIFLDSSIFDGGTGYYAALDEAQFAWLKSDLEALDPAVPVLIISHIPILSACVFFDSDNTKGDWIVPRAWTHIDSPRINDLFNWHPNVRLCLSGHLHLYERVLYNGVTYVCNGAVCAAWWDGPYKQCNPGYGVVDLYDNGTFENEYVEFGWVPLKDRNKAATSMPIPFRRPHFA